LRKDSAAGGNSSISGRRPIEDQALTPCVHASCIPRRLKNWTEDDLNPPKWRASSSSFVWGMLCWSRLFANSRRPSSPQRAVLIIAVCIQCCCVAVAYIIPTSNVPQHYCISTNNQRQKVPHPTSAIRTSKQTSSNSNKQQRRIVTNSYSNSILNAEHSFNLRIPTAEDMEDIGRILSVNTVAGSVILLWQNLLLTWVCSWTDWNTRRRPCHITNLSAFEYVSAWG
jgi:hypothetical protein